MKKFLFLTSITLALFAVLGLPPHAQSQSAYSCTITLDRGNVPDLYFTNITLLIRVNDGQNFSVQTDQSETAFTQSGEQLIVTTKGNRVTLSFNPGTNETNLCEAEAAPLLDNKSWVWSHGFDDNVNLRPAIAEFRAKSWPATIFIIAKEFSQTRDESWIIDEPFFNSTLLPEGWALGNHSWNHERFDTATPTIQDYERDISDAQSRLNTAISRSSAPDFKIITFASPNFSGAYNVPFANETTRSDLRLQETGGDFMLSVTGTSDYTAGEITAKTLSGRSQIGRDISVELDAQVVIGRMDWMAANKLNNERYFWYNTLAHGNHEISLSQIINHVWQNYGPEGTNEAWVASSNEVYSYILTRDNIGITVEEGLGPADPGPLENDIFMPTITTMEAWANSYVVDSQKAQIQPMLLNLSGRGLQNLKEK